MALSFTRSQKMSVYFRVISHGLSEFCGMTAEAQISFGGFGVNLRYDFPKLKVVKGY